MTRCATSKPRYARPALLPSLLFYYCLDPIFSYNTWRHVSQIREARPKLQHRRLRLIHAGRLLADGTHLESWLSTLEERQQRAAATKAKDDADPSILSPSAPLPSSAAAPGPVPALPWLHCSVGAQLSDGDEDGEVQPQVSVSFSVSGSAKISDVRR